VSRRRVTLALATIFLVGLVVRLLALRFEPPHHPDEFFQYLEPAWRRLTGAGVETWEWRNGVRSWVLPGYHGAWMALLMRLGVRDGIKLATVLRCHWALLSLTLVWAGWRGGALLARRQSKESDGTGSPRQATDVQAPPAGWQGGLLGALFCAAFPLLVRFSVHTLSELASMLCLVWALVLSGELAENAGPGCRKKALWIGTLLGFGVWLRIQHAPVALLPVLWLLVARRSRLLAWVAVAALIPTLLFGVVDKLTWGGFFSSYIDYVRFNLLESGADIFGKKPPGWYAQQFFHRLPVGLPLLGVLCLFGLRASWPFVSAALALVVLLSTQAHKEERFAMLLWPLVLISAAGYAGAWLAARTSKTSKTSAFEATADAPPSRYRVWLARVAVGILATIILADGALHARGNDFPGLSRSRFEAQAWVGAQQDVTGLLYDEPLFTGGYLWFGRSFPQLLFKPGLLANPLVSHVMVPRDSSEMRTAQGSGFATVFSSGNIVVLRRKAGVR